MERTNHPAYSGNDTSSNPRNYWQLFLFSILIAIQFSWLNSWRFIQIVIVERNLRLFFRDAKNLGKFRAEFKESSTIGRMSLLMDIYTLSIGKSALVSFLFSWEALFLLSDRLFLSRNDRKLCTGLLLHFGADLPRRYLLSKRGNGTCDPPRCVRMRCTCYPHTVIFQGATCCFYEPGYLVCNKYNDWIIASLYPIAKLHINTK